MKRYTKILLGLFVTCVFAAGAVWRDIYVHQSGFLTVAFLDVGQGDSVYIESPTGVQVLVDAGATRTVLRRLREVMPLFDTSLDMIVATHPDGDHVGGFVDVLGRYRVDSVVYQSIPGLRASPADAFEQALVKWRLTQEERNKQKEHEPLGQNLTSGLIIEPHRGDVWELGGGVQLQILYPDKQGDPKDTNASSIVARLTYGTTSFLLTGDAPKETEEYLAEQDGAALRSDVLKVGHHGSHTSTSALFLAAVTPAYAVISRGCTNTYGHPHRDVLEMLQKFKASVLDTCTEGTVTFTSDGKSVKRR